MKLVVNEAVEILESLDSGIIRLDPACRITYMNPSAERLLGELCEEVAGRAIWDVIPGNAGRRLSEELCRAFRDKTVTSFIDYCPAPINFRLEFRCLPCGEGITMMLDKASDRESPDHDPIDRELLLGQQATNVRKMNSLVPLACGVAHDLKNIFMPIILNTELAMEDLSFESPARPFLNDVLKAARLGTDLVKQITAFSRHEPNEKVPVNLLPIIKETLVFLRSSLPSTIDIHHRLKEDYALVLADAIQIKQVLMNIGSNAAHAMKEMGGLLEVHLSSIGLDEEAAAKISPSLPAGPYIRIAMRDTGHGMDKETQKRIFDPFFSTKKQGEGMGLGLSVVHGIIEDHRGAITVKSEPGRGSTFTVFLPRARQAAEMDDAAPDQRSRDKERILLVKGEKSILSGKRQALSNSGYRVTTVHDPIEALHLFLYCHAEYDLLITEHEMSPVTGLRIAQEALLIRPDIPVILCSAGRDPQRMKEAELLGVREQLCAPILANDLTAGARRLLGKKPSLPCTVVK